MVERQILEDLQLFSKMDILISRLDRTAKDLGASGTSICLEFLFLRKFNFLSTGNDFSAPSTLTLPLYQGLEVNGQQSALPALQQMVWTCELASYEQSVIPLCFAVPEKLDCTWQSVLLCLCIIQGYFIYCR